MDLYCSYCGNILDKDDIVPAYRGKGPANILVFHNECFMAERKKNEYIDRLKTIDNKELEKMRRLNELFLMVGLMFGVILGIISVSLLLKNELLKGFVLIAPVSFVARYYYHAKNELVKINQLLKK